ncbi:MAG TPA: substrate-binding domain-containing protein [Anaeromyxobacteraceae bacterium]|nr:substrate-binding domain-containing protein [Anaeromyxobacteraceae bacterium]
MSAPKNPSLAAAALILAALPALALDQTVRLHGSTAVVDQVTDPYWAAVAQQTGTAMEVIGNSTGRGLVDLVSGRCEVALLSEPLGIAVQAAALAGRTVDPSTLQFRVVKHDQIVFVVHPSNPVTSLTWEQLRDIHTGRVKNWKEVGGRDMVITVVTDTVTGGTRALVKEAVLGGADYGSTSVALSTIRKVADMVGANPNGIGAIDKRLVNPSRNKVLETRALERPLGFATVGPPSEPVRRVLDALEAAVKKDAR